MFFTLYSIRNRIFRKILPNRSHSVTEFSSSTMISNRSHSLLSFALFLGFFFHSCQKNSFRSPGNLIPFLKSSSSPLILAHYPAQNEKNVPISSHIQILFNKPVNFNNCQEAFSISPPIRGSFENDIHSMKFIPNKVLDLGTYIYRLNKSCEDVNGNDIDSPLSVSFSVGESTTNSHPELVSVLIKSSSDSNCNFSNTNNNLMVNSVESICLNSVELQFIFSQEMNKESVKSAITFSPAFPYSSVWNPEGSVLTVKSDRILSSNTRYQILVSSDAKSVKSLNLLNNTTLSFKTIQLNSPLLNQALVRAGTSAECFERTANYINFINNNLSNVCLGLEERNTLKFEFSEPIDPTSLVSGFSINPGFGFSSSWSSDYKVLSITPDKAFELGQRYTFYLNSNLKSSTGIPLEKSLVVSFVVGSIGNPPRIQGIGLESQNCPASFPAVGNLNGGDWTLNSCFWDYQKPLLQASSYIFRGGDSGTGFSGSSNSCSDVNTDNFLVFFDQYMQPSSITSIKLQRISPPFTTIKLSSWVWLDCQNIYPYGCKVVKLIFSEQEASCNGNLFGSNNTGGDFNLSRTDNSPPGFSFYTLSVDTGARDVYGNYLKEKFEFSMEGR